MWLLPGAINAPDSITELATAKERKPAPYAQEVTSLKMHNNSNIYGTVHRNMTRSKSPTKCNSVTEFLLT
jgi:hypothetical protein